MQVQRWYHLPPAARAPHQRAHRTRLHTRLSAPHASLQPQTDLPREANSIAAIADLLAVNGGSNGDDDDGWIRGDEREGYGEAFGRVEVWYCGDGEGG
jgi:hypothetical protein